MAETELTRLIASGRLRTGTVLEHRVRRFPERARQAVVVVDGLSIGAATYATPTAAAEAVTRKPTNGWRFWRIRSTGQYLADLRD